MTFQSKPEGLCLCVEWAFEFLSQCSYHCGLAYTHQYVTIRVRNTCTHARKPGQTLSLSFTHTHTHTHTFYCCVPTLLCPCSLLCWEDDTGWLMKSRRLCTVHYRSSAKNETWALQLLFLFVWAALLCSALTVSGFCSSFGHAIINNCWSLRKLIKFKYEPESRCISYQARRCVSRQLCYVCWPTHDQTRCRASDGGWYLGAGYSWSPWENVHNTTTNARLLVTSLLASFRASQTGPKLITTCMHTHAHTGTMGQKWRILNCQLSVSFSVCLSPKKNLIFDSRAGKAVICSPEQPWLLLVLPFWSPWHDWLILLLRWQSLSFSLRL